MLAVLMLNRMSMKRRNTLKKPQSVAKSLKLEAPVSLCCRTCLSTEDLVPIFYNKETSEKRSHELKLITGLNIRMNDNLSQQICSRCIETMKIVLQFRKTSRKSEKSLLIMKKSKKFKVKKLKTPKLRKRVEKVEKIDYDDDYNYDMFDDYQNDHNYTVIEEEDVKPDIKEKMVSKKRRIIPNASSYKCYTCNKEFKMKATYKAHVRFHTHYCVCETCGKRCRNNNQLQEHKRARHGLGKIHKCAYCEYSSATKEALTIHERRHTGERPYVCDHCGATFHRRSNLVQHIAIHLPEKNFQCDMCPKRLKSKKFLQIHKHNAHTGKKYGYLCPICEHRFEKPNKVRAHTRRVHGMPNDQHPPICPKCHKREKSRKLLMVHDYKVHRENRYRYMCPLCPKMYKRPEHVRRHLTRCHAVERSSQGAIEKIVVKDIII